MSQKRTFVQKLLVGLTLLTIVAVVSASSSSRERRRIGAEDSSHRPGRTYTEDSSSLRPSTRANNAITTNPGRKVSHRLIGGHLRVDGNRDREEQLWDDGILMSSAGNGKEGKNPRPDDDDEKKTLSQQVKEGKYGLIQNELYKERPKRPGIISYLGNPEVPKDTAKNLGGLDEDEIWLAENHVLVLRGGKFPGHENAQNNKDSGSTWPPIDDYKAPRRQVKIPAKPKVPPPFPVQLTDGGPVQIIGSNGSREIGNDTFDYSNEADFAKSLLSEEGPLFAIISNGTIITPDFENRTNPTDSGSPLSVNNKEKKLRPDLPPLNEPPTFYHAIPPGAVFVPPPSNQTDYDDEDQSIYYPPPYSFHFQQDNTTAVPPGPLVPGIILPPPPDFFSALEEKKSTTKKYTKRPDTTPVPRPRPTYLPPRKLTTKQYKATSRSRASGKTSIVHGTTKIYVPSVRRNISTTEIPETMKTTPYVEITTNVPDKTTTIDSTEFYTINSVVGNQVSDGTTHEKNRGWSGTMTTKSIPISHYYSTTTPSSIEKPIEVTPASIKNIITTSSPGRTPNQASYYFYEESNSETAGTTSTPTGLYFRTTTIEPPSYFKVETQAREKEPRKQYYSVETIPSQQTAEDYSVKFVNSVVKNAQVVEYNEPRRTQTPPKHGTSITRAQNQRMLSGHSPVYYQTVPVQSSAPEVQPYYTTPRPINRYRQEPKPKPIYQYSFEAADYSKHQGNQKHSYKQQEQSTIYNDYQDVKTSRPQYVYQDNPRVPEKISVAIQAENVPYKLPQNSFYPSSTPRTILRTTPNPQHAYFTQQDEKLLDDVTKEYFTIFGKKLPGNGIPSTTPIYGKSSSVTERPSYNVNSYVPNNYNSAETPGYKASNVKVHYGDQAQRPYSLKDDTLVNYRQPLPPINPDSEFITKVEQKAQQPYSLKDDTLVNYRQPLPPINPDSEFITIVDRKTGRPYTLINDILLNYRERLSQQPENGEPTYAPINDSPEELDYSLRPYSLEHDIDVNYRDPRPTINPDAEFIDPIPVQNSRLEKPKAYFSYRLPGDGGHFYFQTPQAVTQRAEQGGSNLYPKSRRSRLLRRRRRPGNV